MGAATANIHGVQVNTVGGLAGMVARLRGWTCDLHFVALDHEGGKLHLPLRERPAPRARRRRSSPLELIVRRVVEFSIEGTAGVRWFDLDDLAYDEETRRLSICSASTVRFLLTVEHLDIALRVTAPDSGRRVTATR
jgi:hypothetical protein